MKDDPQPEASARRGEPERPIRRVPRAVSLAGTRDPVTRGAGRRWCSHSADSERSVPGPSPRRSAFRCRCSRTPSMLRSIGRPSRSHHYPARSSLASPAGRCAARGVRGVTQGKRVIASQQTSQRTTSSGSPKTWSSRRDPDRSHVIQHMVHVGPRPVVRGSSLAGIVPSRRGRNGSDMEDIDTRWYSR